MINWSIYRANILLIYTFLLNLENLVLLWFGFFRISLLNCSSKCFKYDWYSLYLFPTVCARQVALIYVEHYQFSALIDPNAYFTNTNGVPSAKLVVHPTKYICNQVQLISAESKARQGSSGTRYSRGTVASSMFAAVKNNFCWHKDWMAPRPKWQRERATRSAISVRRVHNLCLRSHRDMKNVATRRLSDDDESAREEEGDRSPMASMTWHSQCLSWSRLCQMRQVVHEVHELGRGRRCGAGIEHKLSWQGDWGMVWKWAEMVWRTRGTCTT